MAQKSTNTQQKPITTTVATAEKKAPESQYSAKELADAARARFGVPPEVVTTALKLAGKDKATLAEARKIIKDFAERKVT